MVGIVVQVLVVYSLKHLEERFSFLDFLVIRITLWSQISVFFENFNGKTNKNC